jgi:4-amino-4-deoxy-L-arabinose transferase-like glycosyltransferase
MPGPTAELKGARGIKTVLALACAVGLSLPLIDIVSYPERLSLLPSLEVDAATYDALGVALAAGGGLETIPPLQPPGFVAILSIVYRLFGHSLVAAKLLLWLCLAGSTVMAAQLATRVWGAGAGLVAATLVATAPALRYYSATVQYEVLVGAWYLAVVIAVERVTRARGPLAIAAGSAVTGLSAGLLAVTRESFIVLIPLLALWAAGRCRRNHGLAGAVAVAVPFLLAAAVPVAAWSAHQSVRTGRPILISDKGPVTLGMGFNPRATGTYDVSLFGEPSGAAFIRERPLAAVRLVVRKIGYFWGVLRDVWNVPRPAALWLHRASFGLVPLEYLLPVARGGWLLAAFAVASTLLWRRGLLARWWILPASVAAACVAHALTLSSHRFAVPLLPVILVLAAGPMAWLVERSWAWITATPLRSGAGCALALAVLAAQRGPWPYEIVRDAADTDAMNAEHRTDALTGRRLRVVTASAGSRPAMIVGDLYLPAGALQLLLTMSRGGADVDSAASVARATITAVDGRVACSEDVPAGLVPADRLGAVWIPCRLESDGPATLVVHALGVADLAFDEVALVRAKPQK